MSRCRLAGALVLVLALVLVAGCASVPTSSPVQVLRKVTDGEGRALPPGPADGTNPLDLVRGFVYASASTSDRHGAARRFLTTGAAGWDDAASTTVLAEQFDTLYAQSPTEVGTASVRIRGNRVGRLSSTGAFQPDEGPVELDLHVSKEGGQWRIDGLPSGTLMRLSDFRAYYRATKIYFVDPARGATVANLRYVPATPARTMPSRVVELLFAGPSSALAGAAVTRVPPTARLRSNVTETPDGALLVDLTELGTLDEPSRRLIAAQFVQSLAEINVSRVRLLADGAPLVPDRRDLTVADVRDLAGEVLPRTELPGMVVLGGRLHTLFGGELTGPITGPVGSGGVDVLTASVSADGQHSAVVARQGTSGALLIGRLGGNPAPTGVVARTLTRPSWTPTSNEVWTVADGAVVHRVLVDQAGVGRGAPVEAAELAALGPIADLRLSRDGVRLAAVVSGRLAVAALVRSPDGAVAVRNVQVLRGGDATALAALDWRSADTLVLASRKPEQPVSVISVDGLVWEQLPTTNLTPPLSSIAAAPGRPLLVTDQTGLWIFGGGGLDTWRQLAGGAPTAAPLYPG